MFELFADHCALSGPSEVLPMRHSCQYTPGTSHQCAWPKSRICFTVYTFAGFGVCQIDL